MHATQDCVTNRPAMGCGSSQDIPVHQAPYDKQHMPMQSQWDGPFPLTNQQEGPRVRREVDKDTLTMFLELERKISEMENKNPMGVLKSKIDNSNRMEARISALETTLDYLEQKTSNLSTNGHIVNIREIMIQKSGPGPEGEENDLETLELVNQKEISLQELAQLKNQKMIIDEEVGAMTAESVNLQMLYQEQDYLLDDIFGGEYGSSLENRLEHELDTIEEQKNRIMNVTYHWKNAAILVEYGCRQMHVALQKWMELQTFTDVEPRYKLASEARDYLVAASQNIQASKLWLSSIKFPYCDVSEMKTVDTAITHIFTDIQSKERLDHAEECYTVTYKRACGLLQWIKMVMDNIISTELGNVNRKTRDAARRLRNERMSLIKTKLKEIYGEDVDIPEYESGLSEMSDQEAMELVARINESEISTPDSLVDMAQITLPMTLSDLAPLPTKNEIFGDDYDSYRSDLEKLSSEYEKQLEDFRKEVEQNEARVNRSLEEKLMARRQRRARMKLEVAESSALRSEENGEAIPV